MFGDTNNPRIRGFFVSMDGSVSLALQLEHKLNVEVADQRTFNCY